jgi:hypothetical protein
MGMAQFRLKVRNAHRQRTIDQVCIRVVSLVRVDGGDRCERLPITRLLLAITGTGRMPSNPPDTCPNLVTSDSLFFDFVRVYCDRRANHSLCYGECVKRPYRCQGNEMWEFTHDGVLRSGKYKVTIEVQGRGVIPVRKQFVFWGDKTAPHCVDAEDPSAQNTQPLEFAPPEYDTLPPNMHPHQLRALVTELRRSDYDGMIADEVYRKMEEDPTMCGLSQVRFVTSDALDHTKLKEGKWAVIISDDELASFPSGIPGFPNAIRRSDFDIAWQTTRGS